MPEWLRQDVVDVRRVVNNYLSRTDNGKVRCLLRSHDRLSLIMFIFVLYNILGLYLSHAIAQYGRAASRARHVVRGSPTLWHGCTLTANLLDGWELTRFAQDARNVARILSELGKLEVRLEPNTVIHPVRVIFLNARSPRSYASISDVCIWQRWGLIAHIFF